jgi:hypothetical protein
MVLTEDFDLDGWIDGSCGLIKTAKIYRRGDLLTRIDEIQTELEVLGKVAADQRGINDPSVESLEQEWEAAATEVMRTALVCHIQDRTEERRRTIREGLIKDHKLDPAKQADSDTIVLHLIADAIVKVETNGVVKDLTPDGFPVAKLRAIRDRLGDSALMNVRDTFFQVISEAPTVSAPLSRNSSSNRGGVI